MSGRGCSKLTDQLKGVRPRLLAATAALWRECYLDLRRHAGDERLPYDLRATLRRTADAALRRSEAAAARSVVPLVNRRALRSTPPVRPVTEEARLRDAARALGVTPGQPLVTVEVCSREDLFVGVFDRLRNEGFQIARIGDGAIGSLTRRDVIDTTPAEKDPQLETYLLGGSAFVTCASAGLQRAATIAGVPSLRLDARDPFTAYPIREHGLFTLATVVDLDTGRTLGLPELFSELYFRNTRNCGYRPTPAGDIAAAVDEMLRGLRGGWTDSPAQAAFRRTVADAGAELGRRVRHIRDWDAAGGYVGDGRLAAVQAERFAREQGTT